jgi:hypothetical protein
MTELPDRLLRDVLRDTASQTPSTACVDVDALAAWADGTMNGASRAAFEAHAATCARCQALMAAMARTEPPPIEPPRWRRALFTWVMPLAAATAVIVAVGLAITERRVLAPQVAPDESPAAAAPRAKETAADAPSTAAPVAPQARPPTIAEPRRDRPARTQTRTQAAATPAPPPAAASPAPAAPAAAAESGRSAFADRAEAGMRMKAAAAPGPVVLASPVRESQWRIVRGAVEYTEDGGVTWQPQALGVDLPDMPVLAGAAPAARVCWLVGARGLVLLTIDGAPWRRVGFPEPVDLVGITATDASHATVTAADGRRFSTSDGGATWTGRPPDRH